MISSNTSLFSFLNSNETCIRFIHLSFNSHLLSFGTFYKATPHLRSRVAAERSYPMTGQGQRPRGATSHPRSGVAAERSNPTSKQQRLHRRRWAKRSYSTLEVRRGGREDIPLVQGKEQQLHFAGAAMKTYPMSKLGETQKRQ